MKYAKNDNYWNEPTIENSYWAGFIAADGNLFVSKLGSYGLRLNLHEKDRDVLKRLKTALDYTGPLLQLNKKAYVCKAGNKAYVPEGYIIPAKIQPHLFISAARQYHIDLAKWYNITPKKSLTLIPPNITEKDHIAAYITGLIDGDGHIGCANANRGYCHARLEIVGTYAILHWIAEQTGISNPYVILINKNNQNGAYALVLSGDNARKLAQFCLSVDVPRLERKWNKEWIRKE